MLKKYLPAFVLIVVLVITAIILNLAQNNPENLVKNARAYNQSKNYNESIQSYKKALDNWENKTYKFSKEDITKELINVQNSFDLQTIKEATSDLEANNIESAKEKIKTHPFTNPERKELKNFEELLEKTETKKSINNYLDKAHAAFQENDINAALEYIEKAKSISSGKFLINSIKDIEKEAFSIKLRFSQALSKMRKKYDDVQEITWYYDKTSPRYTNYNNVAIYIGIKKDSSPWLRFRIQYTADDWLFINKYIFKIDDSTYEYTPENAVERDNSTTVWEWSDESVESNIYKIITAVIQSKNCKIRCEGDQYYKDRIITKAEKQALQNVLDAYVVLGGKLDFE
jgi:tetratricopeptide (TPR) repeat protein